MKCPVCVEQGLRSMVYGGDYFFRTAMGSQSYYDEDGARHRHDPNDSTFDYSCSNGHRFSVTKETPCPSCDFGHGEPVVKVHPTPPPDPITDRTLPAVGAAGKYLTTDGQTVTWASSKEQG